ncbi:MAG: sulfatase-like hydrolase/transferase [Lachnospiraceae bacterium]|nr:sulfatase-like hydrolase/transferase [Lachnospiraceae bacterium]
MSKEGNGVPPMHTGDPGFDIEKWMSDARVSQTTGKIVSFHEHVTGKIKQKKPVAEVNVQPIASFEEHVTGKITAKKPRSRANSPEKEKKDEGSDKPKLSGKQVPVTVSVREDQSEGSKVSEKKTSEHAKREKNIADEGKNASDMRLKDPLEIKSRPQKGSRKTSTGKTENARATKKITNIHDDSSKTAQDKKNPKKIRTKRFLRSYIIWFILLVFWETVFKFTSYYDVDFMAILFTIILSIPAAGILTFLTTIFNPKANRVLQCIFAAFLSIYFCAQMVYHTIFGYPFSWFSMGNAGQVAQFYVEIGQGIKEKLLSIILTVIPVLAMIIFGKKLISTKKLTGKGRIRLVIATIVTYGMGILAMLPAGRSDQSPYTLYFQIDSPDSIQEQLGVITQARLDAQRRIFGFKAQNVYGDEYRTPATDVIINTDWENPVFHDPNELVIDFDKLIAEAPDDELKDMHQYFASVESTKQNEYTGIFEGYNIIHITAEGFSSWAVDETHTPTLYKLANEGIKFNNFYNPSWPTSTTDGEYVNCTGLLPKAGVWSFYKSAENYLPFVWGNQFKNIEGYSQPLAWHDHTYDFYRRDLSHPNMGYDYKAVGHGLEITSVWPESDLEMMQKTIPDYINEDKFCVYYMTVSGHLQYNFLGNAQAMAHKDEVQDLPYSDAAKAYIACNMTLDKAMEYLLDELEKAGKLNNTVIILSGDHYPYGLTVDEISEIAGHQVDQNFELYKSTLIMWGYGMNGTVVDKPVAAMDIVPTVSNLFGLPFDSRLVMGRDAFSEGDGLVIFSNRNWLTAKCAYNSKTGEVTNFTDTPVTEDYINGMKAVVNNRLQYSVKILERDYYRVLFGDSLPEMKVITTGASNTNKKDKVEISGEVTDTETEAQDENEGVSEDATETSEETSIETQDNGE